MSKTRWHLLFLFSAIAIVVTLGIHMAFQHLNNVLATGEKDPTVWSAMIARAAQGGWVVVYILLLGFGLYHGLYGLRGIIIELTTSAKTVTAINWLFIVVGILFFIWGAYVPITLMSMAPK